MVVFQEYSRWFIEFHLDALYVCWTRLASKLDPCNSGDAQRSQEMFQLAETVAETDPKQALQRYQWIVEHSPKDSRVFEVASARLELDPR